MIPDHISYYRIVRPLGAGAMGEVYVAEDMRLGRNVAVKVLPSRFTTDPDRVRRFEQEARAASALNHPNIITIYDIGEDAHSRFIAMELVEGRTLRALVGEPMPLPQLLSIGRQIAQALHVAHQAGIVHRDIKPENVMVRDDGYVKVLDFGLARLGSLQGGDHTAATLSATSPGTLLGTARYMSPEQARGETVSGASDVFALGTMLYELATGRHPVEATNLVEVLQAVASQPPAIPSALVRDLPPWLDALLLDLLEKDVQHRPTARDVDTMLSQAGRSSSPERLDSPPSTSASRASVRTRSIVGRERERLALQSAFESVASGRGLMVGVAGEPGIGKTTLVEEFVAALTADRERCRIGRGRCSERLAGTEAYLPWLEALDSLRSERGRAAAADTRTMRQLRTIAPTWHSQLVPQGTDAHADAAAHAVRAASQERLKREMGALLEELSREQPLLLFFDDLHWADVSTIDLLAFVASRFSSMPVLIVATYRPSDLALTRHPFLQIKPDLQSRGLCRELALEFLNRSELTAYLDLEFPGHTFPAEFGALVHAKTEGSPLFMADLLRDLRDRGVITRHDNGWQLSQTLQAVQSDLPESMRGMVERKIGQLSDDDRRLLAAASVQGVQFEAAIVARALDVDESSVEERLEILERAYALVRCVGEIEFPNRSVTLRYRFTHILYQGALYRTLRPTRRSSLSRAVAEALVERYGEQRGQVAAELATLYEASRDFVRAAEAFLLAAHHASRVFANHEVIALARRGLTALEGVPDSADRATLELALQLDLGWSLINTRGYSAPEVEEAFARADALCERVNDGRAACQALWGRAMCYLARAQYRRTRELATAMLQRASRIDDPALLVTAHYTLGTVPVYLGEIASARQHFEKGLEICAAHSRLAMPDGRDPDVSCRAQLARVLWLLGYPDQAVTASVAAQTSATALGQPLALAFTYFFDMLLRQFRRELVLAAERADMLLMLAREHGLAQYASWASVLRGWAAASRGDAAGVVEIRDSLSRQDQMGSVLSRPHFLALLAEALAHLGDYEAGLAAIDEGLRTVEQLDERYYEAELYRLKGDLLLDKGGNAAALECFRRAVAVAQQQGARSLELRAASRLARLLPPQAGAEAATLLTRVYDSFTEGHDTADLHDARAVLDALAGAHGSPPG